MMMKKKKKRPRKRGKKEISKQINPEQPFSERTLLIINLSLGFISLLLLLDFLGVELPTIGQAQYFLDREEPLCIVQWNEKSTSWNDLDRCCLAARQQLECRYQEDTTDEGDRLDWMCQTGSGGSGIAYGLNNKAYYYCQQQPYW